METIELILSRPLINKSELARQMFPNQKRPEQYLSDKIHGIQGKRITEKDQKKIENIFAFLIK